MEQIQVTVRYQEFKQQLDTELQKAVEGFVKIGYLLKVARDTNVLKDSGYKTPAEFAKAEYGLSKDAVSRYMAINDRYSEDGYSEQLQERYRAYGYSKLSEMLTLSDEAVGMLSPAMTRTKIQEIKKEISEEQEISDLEVLMEDQNERQQSLDSNLQKVFHQYFLEKHKEYIMLQELINSPEKEPIEAILDAIAPSGLDTKMVRIQGVGKFMLSIKGKDQPLELLNIRTNEKEAYDWPICIWALKDLCPAGDAKELWENLYEIPFPMEVAPVQPIEPEKSEKPKSVESKKVKPVPPEKPMVKTPEPPVITEPEPEEEPEPQQHDQETEVAPVQPEKESEQELDHVEVVENPLKEHEKQAIVITAMITDEIYSGNYDKAYRRAIELEKVIEMMMNIKNDQDSQIAGQMELEEI